MLQMVLSMAIKKAVFSMATMAITAIFHYIYPNNLKNWDLGCAKAPGLIDHNRPNIRNMRSIIIDQSRELSRQPKSNSSGCLGIINMIANKAIRLFDCEEYVRKCFKENEIKKIVLAGVKLNDYDVELIDLLFDIKDHFQRKNQSPSNSRQFFKFLI